jgi:integrase
MLGARTAAVKRQITRPAQQEQHSRRRYDGGHRARAEPIREREGRGRDSAPSGQPHVLACARSRPSTPRPEPCASTCWRSDWRSTLDAVLPPGSHAARTRKTYATQEEAFEAANILKQRLDVAEPVQDQTLTLKQAFTRYFQAKARKKSLAEDKRIAAHLMAAFGETTPLRHLTASKIAAYKASRLAAMSIRRKDADGKATPLGAASINRPLALLRHLLRMAAQDWEVIPKVPVVRLEPAEEARLLDACAQSQHKTLLPFVTVALETGMRKSELLDLTWDRIDLSRGVIRLEVTKSGKRREVPMRQKVYDILSALPEPRTGRVWPDVDIRTAFETAVAKAKVEDFTLRSCRHHFASWFMMNGGSLLSLNRILGHATLAMTTRYAHLSPEHLRGEMERTERTGATGALLEPERGANGGRRLVSTGAGGGS